jgi:hypothetical protein
MYERGSSFVIVGIKIYLVCICIISSSSHRYSFITKYVNQIEFSNFVKFWQQWCFQDNGDQLIKCTYFMIVCSQNVVYCELFEHYMYVFLSGKTLL